MSGEAGRSFQRRLIRLLHAASVEVPARQRDGVHELRELFDPGTDVYISFPPSADYRDALATAVALARTGFNPVPHLPARSFARPTELVDFIARLAGDAGVRQALVIGGDVDPPRGPFAAAIDLLKSGQLQHHGIGRVGLAGHPEGHPVVARAVLEDALLAKIAFAAESGLETYLVTQFCFEGEPILAWLASLSRLGIAVPIRIGVAGPATATTLLRYALRCGVGDSLRAIQTRTKTIGRLISEAGPEEVLRELAAGLTERPDARVVGLHFFPFGGLGKTSDWISDTLSRLYAQITPAAG
ncbi:MAG: methylenetetrahydrofolate reductase [Hyphomicrobiales bacterium]|nr:methylenetetrahydrofolate reductase [Hyphomicrobiales bacterium]